MHGHKIYVQIDKLSLSSTSQELIQNAEDAGATEVKILYDKTQYDKTKLHCPTMERYQVRPSHFKPSQTFAINLNVIFSRPGPSSVRLQRRHVF